MRTALCRAITNLLLIALVLVAAGCGSLDGVSGSATLSGGQLTGSVSAEVPSVGTVTFTSGAIQLRGALPVLVALVDYADATCPYSESQALQVIQQLDSFIVRNSTGAAWVSGRVQRVTLPGEAWGYGGPVDHDDPAMSHPVQVACRAATASAPEAYTLYLLPYTGELTATGTGRSDHRQGWAWVAGALPDPLHLPLPHEFGHALGLVHGGGVMRAADPLAQSDWGGVLPVPGWLR